MKRLSIEEAVKHAESRYGLMDLIMDTVDSSDRYSFEFYCINVMDIYDKEKNIHLKITINEFEDDK